MKIAYIINKRFIKNILNENVDISNVKSNKFFENNLKINISLT